MTATDELRKMLDERGVEWDYGITGATTTRFSVNGIELTFTPMRDGLVCSTVLTSAQVIAMTLRPKVCHMSYNELSNTSICLACGWRMDGKPNYCPNCGAKVVDE